MPIATIQTPQGQIVKLEVPQGATNEQILAFVESQDLSQFQQPAQQDFDLPTDENLETDLLLQDIRNADKPTFGDKVSGTLETAAAIGSSAILEPFAGVAGITAGVFGDVDDAVRAIETVKGFAFEPESDVSIQQLQSIGEAIAPLAEGFQSVENFLGDSVLEATGSEGLAAAAYSLPTAALELLGVKGLKSARSPFNGEKLSSNVSTAITQAAPDLEKIADAKNLAYQQLDELGVKVNSKVYDSFANNLQKRLIEEGIDPTLTPKSSAVLNRILADKGTPKTLQELETLRKIARGAANDIDKTEQRLGAIIINELDSGIDKLSSDIGGKFKEARDLAQRGFRSQAITDMIENASHTASGMENGLRIEARKILKNPKKRKGFSAGQIEALKQIEQGTTAANMAKFLGKFGISEGQATSMLGFSVGAGGGGALGAAFGGPGGAAVGALAAPLVGQIGKRTAQRITLNNTKFADDLARAGSNAKAIVRAYLKHTPNKDRRVGDLTDLLMQTGVNPADIKTLPKSMSVTNKLVADAKFFAEEINRRIKQAGSVAIATTPVEQQEE